jgi:predicted lipoprotein with Yx(FWY)xxD motif
MKKVAALSSGVLLGFALMTGAIAQSKPPVSPSIQKSILTDGQGMTLYTFDHDTSGKSSCTDECAQKWPPASAGKDAPTDGKYGQITRGDGSKQMTYDDKPLYRWVKDQAPGDTTGDGIGGVWHVVRPSRK